MATQLVGNNTNDSSNWQTVANNGTVYYSGYNATASGNAATATIQLAFSVGMNCKIAVFNASGSRIDLSEEFAGVGGGNVASANLTNNCTIIATDKYFLGVIFDGPAGEVSPYHDGGTWNTKGNASGSYASPPSSVAPFDDGSGSVACGHLTIWLEGGAATLTQEGYRWRLDDANEANATWAANQDTGITAPANAVRRLRVLVDTTGDANAAAYRLEYKEANDANYTAIT